MSFCKINRKHFHFDSVMFKANLLENRTNSPKYKVKKYETKINTCQQICGALSNVESFLDIFSLHLQGNLHRNSIKNMTFYS